MFHDQTDSYPSDPQESPSLEELGVTFAEGPFPAEYMYSRSSWGVWRRSVDEHNRWFAEFKTYWSLFGYPLLHITYGVCPSFKTRLTARGWLAIGRFAMGGLAIGHVAVGIIGIGQASLGVLLGLGQATGGLVSIGQLSLGVLLGLGQLTTGHIAVGQLAFGEYVLAQLGFGAHVWDTRGVDIQARQFFTLVWQLLSK